MLGNNEKIPGVNIADLFAAMVKELPWRTLKEYITGNAQLQKICTIGGHRIDPNQRPFLEKQVIREAERAEYSEMTCNAVFAIWYPVHEAIHQNLEGYFKSDEYKAYRTENKLTEEDYVLPQEKFEAYFQVNDIKAWTILLAFAPLKFTQEQADAILNNRTGSAELVEKVAALEAQLAEANRKAANANADAEKARQQQAAAASELQELKKAQRQFKADLDAANQRFTSASAEIKRLTARLAAVDSEGQKREQEFTENAQREVTRIKAEFAKAQADLNGWQNKYQEQLLANRDIVANANAVEKRAAEADAARDAALEKLAKSQKFVDLLLDRIDWSKLGTQLKLTPAIRRNFNSLIKRLNYEEDLSLTIEGTLPQFWARLSKSESDLIAKIANSNTLEVQNGDMEGFWNEVQDSFADVQSSLEARIFMINFISELLFSIYMPDQLAAPVIPTTPKKKAAD